MPPTPERMSQWRCSVKNMMVNGKRIMTREIQINFLADEILIQGEEGAGLGSGVYYRVSRLEIEDGMTLLSDGLKIVFNSHDRETTECYQTLQLLISEKQKGKKEKKGSSGPKNTLSRSNRLPSSLLSPSPLSSSPAHKGSDYTPLDLQVKSHGPAPIAQRPELGVRSSNGERTSLLSNTSPSHNLEERKSRPPSALSSQNLKTLPQPKRQSLQPKPTAVVLPPATQSSPIKLSRPVSPESYEDSSDFLVDIHSDKQETSWYERRRHSATSGASSLQTPPRSLRTFEPQTGQKRISSLIGCWDAESRKKQSFLKRTPTPAQGIPNLGNTCFMAAVIQVRPQSAGHKGISLSLSLLSSIGSLWSRKLCS
jgi:hypothetical protein